MKELLSVAETRRLLKKINNTTNDPNIWDIRRFILKRLKIKNLRADEYTDARREICEYALTMNDEEIHRLTVELNRRRIISLLQRHYKLNKFATVDLKIELDLAFAELAKRNKQTACYLYKVYVEDYSIEEIATLKISNSSVTTIRKLINEAVEELSEAMTIEE